MNLIITPVDVLFFRDSKPFSRGSEHYTQSLFPPMPQTLYGALRTKAMENLGCDYEEFARGVHSFQNAEALHKAGGIELVKEEIGTADSVGSFHISGPFLQKNGEVYFPVPQDIKQEEGNNVKSVPFQWADYGIISDFPEISHYPHVKSAKPIQDEHGTFISLSELVKYLRGETITHVISPGEIFEYETRTGIGVENTALVTGEGLLYTIGYVRMKEGWSFFAKAENLSSLPESGFIKFGGANRVCQYKHSERDPFSPYYEAIHTIKDVVEKSKHFKLVLLTPAEFINGWISSRFNHAFELEINGIKVELISVSLGRPINISGWDLAKKRARPLRRLVPAGSVLYFEIREGSADKVFESINMKCFTDNLKNFGLGLSVIGGW